MSVVPVIAIDGPSGSGKGTIARRVAGALLGCAGWSLYHNLLDDFLPRHKKVSLADLIVLGGCAAVEPR